MTPNPESGSSAITGAETDFFRELAGVTDAFLAKLRQATGAGPEQG